MISKLVVSMYCTIHVASINYRQVQLTISHTNLCFHQIYNGEGDITLFQKNYNGQGRYHILYPPNIHLCNSKIGCRGKRISITSSLNPTPIPHLSSLYCVLLEYSLKSNDFDNPHKGHYSVSNITLTHSAIYRHIILCSNTIAL